MKREIKFRAWDGGKMSKPFSLHELEGYEGECNAVVYNEHYPEKSGRDMYSQWTIAQDKKIINDTILLQYTGLKDINGKEIYEGDIVQFELEDLKLLPSRPFRTIKATIEWCNSCCFGFRAQWHEWANNVRLGDINKDENELKIIGNIYENPELLNS